MKRDLGWIEGQNIAIEYRWAAGRRERLPALAAELLDLKVELIVTGGGAAARAAQGGKQDDPHRDGGGYCPCREGACSELGAAWGKHHGFVPKVPRVFWKIAGAA